MLSIVSCMVVEPCATRPWKETGFRSKMLTPSYSSHCIALKLLKKKRLWERHRPSCSHGEFDEGPVLPVRKHDAGQALETRHSLQKQKTPQSVQPLEAYHVLMSEQWALHMPAWQWGVGFGKCGTWQLLAHECHRSWDFCNSITLYRTLYSNVSSSSKFQRIKRRVSHGFRKTFCCSFSCSALHSCATAQRTPQSKNGCRASPENCFYTDQTCKEWVTELPLGHRNIWIQLDS